MQRITLVFIWLLSVNALRAQDFVELFPGLLGTELLNNVIADFKPDTVLPYNLSRDTLYSKVYAIDDDSLRCVYTGHTLYLDPTQDPTQYVYLNGIANGMNAEHAYPQSKGAEIGFARSDMHHLYPTRIAVNEARSILPFAEIPDNNAQRWYRGTTLLSTAPPLSVRDEYTEWSPTAFEPRESVKGDIARSVFYIYTMYQAQADAADPNFFQLQRATLCQWNVLDPVDEQEWTRTWRVAPYQDGKPNPFIIDCTLAFRSWCPNDPASCMVPATEATRPQLQVKVLPQPLNKTGNIELELPFSGTVDLRLVTLLGQEVRMFQLQNTPIGRLQVPLDLSNLVDNSLFLQVRLSDGQQQISRVIPLILAK